MKIRHIKRNKAIQQYIRREILRVTLGAIKRASESMKEKIEHIDYMSLMEHPEITSEQQDYWTRAFLPKKDDEGRTYNFDAVTFPMAEDMSDFVGPRMSPYQVLDRLFSQADSVTGGLFSKQMFPNGRLYCSCGAIKIQATNAGLSCPVCGEKAWNDPEPKSLDSKIWKKD